MIEISIIILNYNTTDYISRLVSSIKNNLDLSFLEVILIDNNSTDKSFRFLVNQFPFLKIVENKKNVGFASGNNIAVNFAKGKYLLFLNPDILIIDDSIKKLKEYIEQNKDIGILSGLMLDSNFNPLYFYNNFLNTEWELYNTLGIGYARKIKELLSIQEIKESVPFEVDWFHGAFIFISKTYFNIINGFNENHFMYYEDMQLCFKVKNKLKLKNVCLPFVKYIHETRSTFKNISEDDLYYFHINRGKLIFIKEYNFMKRNSLKIISAFGIIIRILYLPFWYKYNKRKKGKFNQLIKILKLHFSQKYLVGSKYEFIK